MINNIRKITLFNKTLTVFSVLIIVIGLGLGLFLSMQTQSSALSGNDFRPGRIIDDAVFYNKSSMNVSAISSFLQSKVPECDTNGSKPAADKGRQDITRAQYAALVGWHAPPYTCLKDYSQNTPQMESASELCAAIPAKTNVSSAQIIFDVANACDINPQVLIVLLEKEQSLVRDVWPLRSQLNKATGFACPDTAPCDPAFGGFFYQVYYAARQFKVYQKYPDRYNYVAGRNNNIYYHPDLARCGHSPVYIENQATAALYIYTPYQPNSAALNNLYGTGNNCSSYGNRNFWRLFTEWFGSTYGSGGFVSLDDPRWMAISTNTKKINAYTGKTVEPLILSGAQAKFIDKIFINGTWIARTQWDYDNGNVDGFKADELIDISFQDIPETWMVIPLETNKIDPLRGFTHEKAPAQTLARFVDKISINGKDYYRTQYEKDNSRSRAFSSDVLSSYQLFSFKQPRLVKSNTQTDKIDILTGDKAGLVYANDIDFYNRLINYDGTTYAQMRIDNGTNIVVDASKLFEMDNNLFNKINPGIFMRLSKDTTKYDVLTGEAYGPLLGEGSDALFIDKVKVNGHWFMRTKWDYDNKNNHGIALSDLTDINPEAINKIEYTVKFHSEKINPLTNERFEDIKAGSKAVFVDKISINGKEYYRTEWEFDQGRYRFIPASDLSI